MKCISCSRYRLSNYDGINTDFDLADNFDSTGKATIHSSD